MLGQTHTPWPIPAEYWIFCSDSLPPECSFQTWLSMAKQTDFVLPLIKKKLENHNADPFEMGCLYCLKVTQ